MIFNSMKIKNKERVCTCCGEVGHYGGKLRAENESNPKDGWFRLYWENDQLRYEWEYKDSQRADGISKAWFPSGQIKSIHTYKDGEIDGLMTNWYENGHKRYEGTIKDGVLNDGLYTDWYENGQKRWEGSYKEGKEDGLGTSWYENGQKGSEGTYKDGKQDGLWTYWYDNGQKEEERTYKNGEEISVKEWNEDGSVKE